VSCEWVVKELGHSEEVVKMVSLLSVRIFIYSKYSMRVKVAVLELNESKLAILVQSELWVSGKRIVSFWRSSENGLSIECENFHIF